MDRQGIKHVEPHAERTCLRGDTDFSLTAHFDRWAERADFIFGMDANVALRGRAEALDEASWATAGTRAEIILGDMPGREPGLFTTKLGEA